MRHTSRQPEENSISVWIIEDDGSYRSTMLTLLEQTAEVDCTGAFSSCEEALGRLEKDSVPDVVLLDISFPGMNGIEALKSMKAVSPGTDVIMLTIHEKNDLIFEAICAGASGYLTKGATGDEIVRAIRDVFDGGAPMNAHIARKVLYMFASLNVPQNNYGLTQREKEILSLMVEGSSMKQVADRLNVSYYTIDTHQKNIYLKLQVHTRSGAVAKVLKEHII